MATINNIDLGSDSDNSEDFNPAPAVGSDEEGESDHETERSNKPASKRLSPSQQAENDEDQEEVVKRNGTVADENEDEDEEDEEDDEEDEEDAVTVDIGYSNR